MDDLVNRYRRGELDLVAAALQLGCFVGFVLLMIACALLYRYLTDAALEPVWSFLASIKVAVPPVIILAVTYLYAFLTGDSITDAPKSMWSTIRNRALQQKWIMLVFLMVVTVTCLSVFVVLFTKTPPAYTRLVSQILGGENDDQLIASESIKKLKESNPSLSDQLEIVRRVFEERRLWNHDNKQANTTLPRIFIRSLEANISDSDWRDHPLRWHAAAEAYSMLAQAIASQSSPNALNLARINRDAAISFYTKVLDSKSVWVTPLMRASAEQNIATAYYYSGDFQHALEAYIRLSDKAKSPGVDANRVATLVRLHRFDDAVKFGNQAMHDSKGGPELLTEIREYISLATNTGFAELILNRNAEALDNLQEAYDLLPDAMARQNLALALDATGDPDAALGLLAEDTDAPIVTEGSEFDVISRRGGGNCTYLIRAAALSHKKAASPEIAANLAAYARQAQPKDRLESDIASWRAIASHALNHDVRPCGGLQLLPGIGSALS